MKAQRFPIASFVPENIAIRCTKDRLGLAKFRPSELTGVAATRFVQVLTQFLRGGIMPPDSAAYLPACLIFFEAVATPESLSRALAHATTVFRWRGKYCLDWADPDDRLDRRLLSPFTVSALAWPFATSENPISAIKTLDSSLRRCVRLGGQYGLEILLRDAQAWLFEHLEGPWFAHCLGISPMTALPRSALAREETHRVLAPLETSIREPSQGFGEALSGYFDTIGDRRGARLIDAIEQACKPGSSGADATRRRKILTNCLALTHSAAEAGPLPSLILAWIIDLTESGTRQKSLVDPDTIYKYSHAAARRLSVAFRSLKLEEASSETFIDTYRSLQLTLSPGQQKTLASALHSWHHFLETWLDVEPLDKSLYQGIPATAPKASIVWQHELDRVASWLRHAKGDLRLADQIRVAWAIATKVRIRINELVHLQVRNLRFLNNLMEIEICTPSHLGGLKTPAARRVQTIRAPKTIAMLKAWIRRRRKEGALETDLLFGDPMRPGRLYRVGSLCQSLNLVLKAATGDPTASFHALSHTRISFDLLARCDRNSGADINPNDVASAEYGHASSTTTFTTYFHLYEQRLREQVDTALMPELDWPTTQSFVALSHAAFRQTVCRQRKSGIAASAGSLALRSIQLAAPSLLSPTARKGTPMRPAKAPLPDGSRQALRVTGVLAILQDLAQGYSSDVIALRSDQPRRVIRGIAIGALNQLRDLAEVTDLPRRVDHPFLEFHRTYHNGAVRRIQLDRAIQTKFENLSQWLERHPDTPSTLKAIHSWKSCYRKGYLDLTDPARASGLVDLLDDAGVDRDKLLIRTSLDIRRPDNASFKHQVDALFFRRSPILPLWDASTARRGRPRTYLLLGSKGVAAFKDQNYPTAASSVAGLHALLLATATLSEISRCEANSCAERSRHV